jgi:hypothetical protein
MSWLGTELSTGIIQTADRLPFRLAGKIGEGENAAVFSLGPSGEDVWYTDDSDDDCNGSSCSHSHDSSHDSDSCSYSCYSDDEEDGASEHKDGADARDVVEICDVSGHDKDEPVSFDVERVRVHAQTSMGKTQLVAKVSPHLDEESCAVVIDNQEKQLIRAFDDIEEAEIYVRRRHFKAPRFEAKEISEFVSGNFVGYSAFVVECVCNLLLTKLVDQGLTPHVLIATQAIKSKNNGYLLLERIDCTLDDLLADPQHCESSVCKRELTNREVASLFLQAVCAIDTLQRVCKLKHHDLHTGNVFLRRIVEGVVFRGVDLSTATHFHYHVNGSDFYVPNCGLLVKIGDFGMTSFNMGEKRVQRVDMDVFNDDVEKWGAWNAHYEGERGYDTQVLFADIPTDGRHIENHELHRFFKHARATTTGKRGRVSRKKGRPLPGHVSNLPASSVLESVFKRRLEPWFDFTAPPAEGTVVTLSDTRWL